MGGFPVLGIVLRLEVAIGAEVKVVDQPRYEVDPIFGEVDGVRRGFLWGDQL